VLVADVPATEAPTMPTFSTRVSFAGAPGPLPVVVRAVDAQGRFGPPQRLAIELVAPPEPAGELVITLRWDTMSDLDLHVVDSTGVEIWARRPSAYEPPPPPALPDPDGPARSGQLVADSNGGCVLDGRNREDVAYPTAPPPGRLVVRVDAPSLCGADAARWRVEVRQAGVVIAVAAGSAWPSDTRGAHELSAGRTALELDLP
jgi:hypothetical protein